MLLSEKDSVVYPRCLAPELRSFRFPHNVHRVPDYTGAGQEQKKKSIREIVAIARDHGYTHVFAGYGFMAEDAELVEAIEQAGVGFMGPSLARAAPRRREGRGQEARAQPRQRGDPRRRRRERARAARAASRTARDSRSSRRSTGSRSSFSASELARSERRGAAAGRLREGRRAGRHRRAAEARPSASAPGIWRDYPTHRIRFKYIGGGGGKGQRVVCEARPDRGRGHGRVRGVEGDRAGLEPELPDRAQHRAHAPQRDPADRQRRLVPEPRRPRLLGADARAEAGRGLAHPGAARRRDRARERRDARGADRRPRLPRSAWRPRARSSARRPGSTRCPRSSASSTASTSSSWR